MTETSLGILPRMGAAIRRNIDGFGEFWVFSGKSSGWMSRGLFHAPQWRLLMPQLYEVGYRSLPVILITGAFVGMVLAVQAIEQFRAVIQLRGADPASELYIRRCEEKMAAEPRTLVLAKGRDQAS